jgi:type II secretory pathway component PulK
MLGALGAEFAYSMRLEASAVSSYKDSIVAGHLAEAAIAQAIRELAGEWASVVADDHGDLVFISRERTVIPPPPRRDVVLGPGTFSYRLRDEEALLNINTAQPGRLETMLDTMGLQRAQRDQIIDSIQDWRDANEEARPNGAESEFYSKLKVPYRARNGNFESTAELLQVRGITTALFYGVEGQIGLGDIVTVRTVGQVNLNTAGPLVLRTFGLSEAEVTTVLQTRREAPYLIVPGAFAGRGFAVTTRTFRVYAEGAVHGRVAARIAAVLRRNSASDIAIVEWSGLR